MVDPTSRIRRKKLLLQPGLRERSIYLLPNLFTTAALFAGFYAIVQAMNGRFEHSAVAIFIAVCHCPTLDHQILKYGKL